MVYYRGKEYENSDDLHDAVQETWSVILCEYLLKIYRCMSKIILSVIYGNGFLTQY